jgi:Ca2+-binding EF-hand superfamily protein
VDGSGLLTAAQLKTFLTRLPLNLTADEVSACLDGLTIDENGDVSFSEFTKNYEMVLSDAMVKVSLNKMATNVELFLVHIFRKADTDLTNTLSFDKLDACLRSNERIALTSIQIHAMLTEYKGSDAVEYGTTARITAYAIYKLFDKVSLKEKSTLINRSNITPIALLSAQSKQMIISQMEAKFREFDVSDSGKLTKEEFNRCMADTGLVLSRKEINTMRRDADKDEDGMISVNEFMDFCFDVMLQLVRNDAIKKGEEKANSMSATEEALAGER